MAKSKIYVVYVGRQPGLYETWDECRAEVEGYPGARYKSFYSKEEAVMSMRESDASASMALRQIARHLQEDTPEVVAPRTKKASPSVYPPDVILNSLAVDAGCMGNPGIMEYRGVYVQTGQEVFKVGPYHDGTNNIGEFLAIVHGLALLKQKGSNIPIRLLSAKSAPYANRIGRCARYMRNFCKKFLSTLAVNSGANRIHRVILSYCKSAPATLYQGGFQRR